MPQSYPITVDYNKTITEMLEVYQLVNPEIYAKSSAHDKSRGVEKVETQLIPFGRPMRDNEVLEEYRKRGLRSATPQEQYTFGGQHPTFQKKFLITIITDWTDGEGCIGSPYLTYSTIHYQPESIVEMCWNRSNEEWEADVQFLAVAVA